MGFPVTAVHNVGDSWASLPRGMTVALFGPARSVLQCSFSFFASAQGRAWLGDGRRAHLGAGAPVHRHHLQTWLHQGSRGYSEAGVQPPLLTPWCWSGGSTEPI